MYKTGDLIIYGSHGVCKVEAADLSRNSSADKSRIYYILRPIYQDFKIYVPIDTNVFMRMIITYEEAQKLISLIPSIRENVYDNSNLKLLEDYYKEFLQTHDCFDLLKILKIIYIKKNIAMEHGRKIGAIDERFMRKAEDLLYGEFAIALGIPKESVKGYIEDKVNELLKVGSEINGHN